MSKYINLNLNLYLFISLLCDTLKTSFQFFDTFIRITIHRVFILSNKVCFINDLQEILSYLSFPFPQLYLLRYLLSSYFFTEFDIRYRIWLEKLYTILITLSINKDCNKVLSISSDMLIE